MSPRQPPTLRPTRVVTMQHPTDESYLPYSRGLEEHLPRMARECRLALYVYNLLLFRADYRGPNRGKVAISIRQIANFFGVDYHTAYNAVKWLKDNGYITYEPARNQHSATRFTITKYKTVEDFIPSSAFGRETKGSPKANQKRPKSNPSSDGDINELQDPNNYKNYKETYGGEIEEVFDAYNAIMQIRSRSNSRKSKIQARLREYGKDEILRAIENYHQALDDPDHYFTYRFPVERFMTPENIDRFLAMELPAEKEWEELADGAGRT